MTHNAQGTAEFMVPESGAAMMRAYDELPKIVRDVYKYAAFNSAVVAQLQNWVFELQYTIEARQFAAARWSVNEVFADQECYRTYGPDHPQSNNHVERLHPNEIAIWGNTRG